MTEMLALADSAFQLIKKVCLVISCVVWVYVNNNVNNDVNDVINVNHHVNNVIDVNNNVNNMRDANDVNLWTTHWHTRQITRHVLQVRVRKFNAADCSQEYFSTMDRYKVSQKYHMGSHTVCCRLKHVNEVEL